MSVCLVIGSSEGVVDLMVGGAFVDSLGGKRVVSGSMLELRLKSGF